MCHEGDSSTGLARREAEYIHLSGLPEDTYSANKLGATVDNTLKAHGPFERGELSKKNDFRWKVKSGQTQKKCNKSLGLGASDPKGRAAINKDGHHMRCGT